MRDVLAAFGLAALLAAGASAAEKKVSSQYQPLRLLQVVDGLDHPWAMAFLPDGDMLVTERPGRLLRVSEGSARPVSGVPEVAAHGQGGLLDVALHPAFEENGLVYLTYSKPSPGSSGETATALARGRLEGTALDDVRDIFVQDRYSGAGRHYGSRLAFLPDGTLLMSIGDRGSEPPRAQDLGDHAGSLLRLHDDGSVPDDNPFVGRDGALAEIYSYGHRNIQGLIVHPESGEIWATEHGPRGGDELNRVEPGRNYGWPRVSRGLNYRTQQPYFEDTVRSKEGMVDPVIDWTPMLAPSGLALLAERGPYSATWAGNLFAGGLRSEQVRRVVFMDGVPVHEEELLRGELGRIRDVRRGPDGLLYVATDNGGGEDGIWRLEPDG
jgi:aldose sugar dehydrogenase